MYVSLGPSNDSAVTAIAVSSAAGSDIAAVSGVAGQIIRVYKLFLVCNATTNLTFKDGSTALSGALPLAANGSITLDMDGTPWFTCGRGNTFNINSSAATQVSGAVYYTLTGFLG